MTGLPGRPHGLGVSAMGVAYALPFNSTVATRFSADGGGPLGSVVLAPNPIDVAFTSSGDLAYFTSYDGSRVYEANAQTGAVLDSFAIGSRHYRILMHPDDSRFWVTTIDGRVFTVDRASGVSIDTASTGLTNLRGISRHPTNGTLVVSGDQGLRMLDGSTLDSLAGWSNPFAQEVVHSADGSRLFVAAEGLGRVLVLEASTLSPYREITFGSANVQPFGMRLSPDGNTLVISSTTPAFIATVDPRTLVTLNVIAPGGMPRRVAFSPDGKRAFVANELGWVDVLK